MPINLCNLISREERSDLCESRYRAAIHLAASLGRRRPSWPLWEIWWKKELTSTWEQEQASGPAAAAATPLARPVGTHRYHSVPGLVIRAKGEFFSPSCISAETKGPLKLKK